MEKIDFGKVKRLSRILSGNELPMQKRTAAEKLLQAQTKMNLESILPDVLELKTILKKLR